MREDELRKSAVCGLCGQKIMKAGLPFFWRVRLERFGVDLKAAERQQGLTMFLGGSAKLASVMGPNEDLALPVMDPLEFTVCEKCGTDQSMPISALPESVRRGS